MSKALDRAVSQGREHALDDAAVRETFPGYAGSNTLKQLEPLIQNWTEGMAERTITYNVNSGLDTWRKLYHDQLPAIHHQ